MAAPVGFAGLAAAGEGVRHAGMVVDRTSLFHHAATDAAVSIDEFAVALHRDAACAIDPALGWHLWATDLCLQARARTGRPAARIVDVPLFHNSTTGYTLPEAFHASGQVLLDKHPQLTSVPTLCGELERLAAS